MARPLLNPDHLQQDMPVERARESAQPGFGNIDRIGDQCVEVSKSVRLVVVALKYFLIVLFLAGVFVRIVNTELHATRVGDMLILIGALGRLFLYARYSSRTNFLAEQPASPLKLSETSEPSVYDQRKRTPLERVISDE
jgi:hypothetical protein